MRKDRIWDDALVGEMADSLVGAMDELSAFS
jgi:hypothetical protein